MHGRLIGPRMARSFSGLAGEHLVIYDLLRQGIQAFHAGPNLRYDIVADIDGHLVRIQVKATSKKSPYIFRARDGISRHYEDGALDILALVALDTESIAYIPFHHIVHKSQITLDAKTIRQNNSFKAAYERLRSL